MHRDMTHFRSSLTSCDEVSRDGLMTSRAAKAWRLSRSEDTGRRGLCDRDVLLTERCTRRRGQGEHGRGSATTVDQWELTWRVEKQWQSSELVSVPEKER